MSHISPSPQEGVTASPQPLPSPVLQQARALVAISLQ